MSSILTNTGAMTALQTLKGINKNMADVQNQISTGKRVESAKDSAAVWAISKVMDSDVKGFEGIADSLALGESSVAVARNAAESVADLLTDMKGKIVAAQEENVDRAKLQTDIEQLRDQITSVVGAAQFNGLNLVDGSAGSSVDILSSLDRAANGRVTASNITVTTQDLTGEAGTTLTAGIDVSTASISTGGTATSDVGSILFGEADAGTAGTFAINASDMDAGVDPSTGALMAGDTIRYALGDSSSGVNGEDYLEVEVRVDTGDSEADIQAKLFSSLSTALDDATNLNIGGVTQGDLGFSLNNGAVRVTTGSATALGVAVEAVRGEGGLAALASIDVTTDAGASDALTDIEGLIQTSIDAASEFGSVQSRIETQSDFVSKLTDSLKAGIGTLVDADMEEASARLQALQVQQQLATQSLSIANQAPQNLLSLFR
jgi:flagellin